MKLRSRKKALGLTLVELVIATAIMAGVVIGIFTLLVSVLKQERQNLQMLKMAYSSQQMHRELRRVSIYGASITTTGNTVQFTNLATSTVAELRYTDEDNDPNTIRDNSISFDPDISVDDDERVTIHNVSPLVIGTTAQPVFSRAAGVPSPLIVQFRIGDRSGPIGRAQRLEKTTAGTYKNVQAHRDDAITGEGMQTMVFRAAYAPRII